MGESNQIHVAKMDEAKSAKGFTKSSTTRLVNAEQALACVEQALMELGKGPNPPPQTDSVQKSSLPT